MLISDWSSDLCSSDLFTVYCRVQWLSRTVLGLVRSAAHPTLCQPRSKAVHGVDGERSDRTGVRSMHRTSTGGARSRTRGDRARHGGFVSVWLAKHFRSHPGTAARKRGGEGESD